MGVKRSSAEARIIRIETTALASAVVPSILRGGRCGWHRPSAFAEVYHTDFHGATVCTGDKPAAVCVAAPVSRLVPGGAARAKAG